MPVLDLKTINRTWFVPVFNTKRVQWNQKLFNILCTRAMSRNVSLASLMQFGTGFGLTKVTNANGITLTNNVDF